MDYCPSFTDQLCDSPKFHILLFYFLSHGSRWYGIKALSLSQFPSLLSSFFNTWQVLGFAPLLSAHSRDFRNCRKVPQLEKNYKRHKYKLHSCKSTRKLSQNFCENTKHAKILDKENRKGIEREREREKILPGRPT